eukprot:4697195-Amphidinium_carterae.1
MYGVSFKYVTARNHLFSSANIKFTNREVLRLPDCKIGSAARHDPQRWTSDVIMFVSSWNCSLTLGSVIELLLGLACAHCRRSVEKPAILGQSTKRG